jgi:hypothetical protein
VLLRVCLTTEIVSERKGNTGRRSGFLGRSPSREMRLLALSCPFICPRVSAQFPLDGFHETLYWERLHKYVEKLRIWLKSDKNVRHFHEDLRKIYCFRRHKFTIKHFCAALSIFMLFILTRSSVVEATHYWVSTATMGTRTRVSFTFYVRCPSCLFQSWTL